MRYLVLVWRNLLRRKTRTLMTLGAIFVSFALFGVLMPAVTAGLTWAPETPPNVATAIESASPCASAMPTMVGCAPPAAVPLKIAAIPAKHRKNVPRNSAVNARVVVISSPLDRRIVPHETASGHMMIRSC